MIPISSTLLHYRRRLPRPIVTSHGRYLDREGMLLVVRDRRGRIGVGEAAPLAGISPDSLRDSEVTLESLTKTSFHLKQDFDSAELVIPKSAREYFEERGLRKHSSRTAEILNCWFTASPMLTDPTSPAAFFATGTALADLKTKRDGLTLSGALAERETAKLIPLNGLLTATGVDDTCRQACTLDNSGYKVFKIKVGYDSPADDVLRVRAVCDVIPNALIRLDANGGWDPDWAHQVLTQIPLKRIDFIEQPFPRGSARSSIELAKEYRVRLALDEEIQNLNDAEGLITKHACDVIVLKPMVLGHLYGCFHIARRAREAGIEVIYTSSWESDIGIAATLHLAAALGPHPPAMGLSTAGMISQGIVKTPLKIENGFLKVPEGPGLGIELAPELLAQLN